MHVTKRIPFPPFLGLFFVLDSHQMWKVFLKIIYNRNRFYLHIYTKILLSLIDREKISSGFLLSILRTFVNYEFQYMAVMAKIKEKEL